MQRFWLLYNEIINCTIYIQQFGRSIEIQNDAIFTSCLAEILDTAEPKIWCKRGMQNLVLLELLQTKSS